MAALASPTPLNALVEETVKSFAPPKGVRLNRIFLDLDHTGDPAIRVNFCVSERIALTKPRVRELNDFRVAVWNAFWNLQSGYIPYVRFREAS
jgi:hypothetical protein